MPGYILHLSEARMVIDIIESHYAKALSKEWKSRFALGALLPDSKKGQEKRSSHFWRPEELERRQLALAPDLSRFEKKYGTEYSTPEMWGYWLHLHLDQMFVRQYWKTNFEFIDQEGKPEEIWDKIDKVWIINRQYSIPVDQFFSAEYYYGDYSRMNTYFTKKYHVILPMYHKEDWIGFPVEEVNAEDIKEVIHQLEVLLTSWKEDETSHLLVFSLDDLEQFLKKTAKEAAERIVFCDGFLRGCQDEKR